MRGVLRRIFPVSRPEPPHLGFPPGTSVPLDNPEPGASVTLCKEHVLYVCLGTANAPFAGLWFLLAFACRGLRSRSHGGGSPILCSSYRSFEGGVTE